MRPPPARVTLPPKVRRMSSTPVSLLERLRDRPDEGAWQQLVSLYTPLLRHWLNRYSLPDADAEDLTQEVFSALTRELPGFHHSRRSGAFRHWLRVLLVNRLRAFWRARDHRPAAVGGSDLLSDLNRLEDPASHPSRCWDEEHDRHVVRRLLAAVRGEFQSATWAAFEAVMLRGESPADAAARLDVSVNAVLLAKSRVLRRLRQEGRDLLD